MPRQVPPSNSSSKNPKVIGPTKALVERVDETVETRKR
jgi:hypothetical protein